MITQNLLIMSYERITKEQIRKASKKASEVAFASKIEAAKEKVLPHVEAIIRKYVSQEILDISEKYYDVFRASLTLYPSFYSDNGKAYVNIPITFKVPSNIKVSDEDLEVIKEYQLKLSSIERGKYEYALSVEKTLLDLKTRKQIEARFPEMIPYLFDEEHEVSELSSLRKALQNNDDSKEFNPKHKHRNNQKANFPN